LIAFSAPPLLIEVIDGDIASERVDAVVNAANNHFWMGGGVAGALKARGGPDVERDAMAQGPVDPGGCVIGGGHGLAATHVIHAAVMGQDLQTSATLIRNATDNALALAERHRLVSVAFPAFGTGVGGFPIAECGRIMMEAVGAHARSAATVRLVRFVLFGRAPYEQFALAAAERFGRPLDGPPDCPLSG
jgi:O-acetyl-ADP-ribose deacetylase (regulator of RNase III)